ncbi:MAG: NAD(P)H-hydrate dehydratase [Bacteroidales bacterium]|jgi:NAD(P)H-hydrate epimerase
MKIFTGSQIREIDRYTIENEPVRSADLMERAAGKLFEWIIARYSKRRRFLVFAGPGNNGGDGLVLARLLGDSGYMTEVYYVRFSAGESDDWKINMERLQKAAICKVFIISSPDQIPVTLADDIIIDAILGSGLTRPVEGLAESVIKKINESACEVIAVDIPSGLPGEDTGSAARESIVNANQTLSFQFPKLSFMFSDSFQFVGDWHILPIGLHPDAIRETATPYYYIEENDVIPLIRQRNKFDHKGTFGHGLLVAGSANKAGAAVLASRAALRTGIGLVTCRTPAACCAVIQSALPEAMVSSDSDRNIITSVPDPDDFSAVGAGPGLGTDTKTAKAFRQLLEKCSKPLVIDADALNILGQHKDWFSLLKPATILTPHPKEFERLAGKTSGCYQRLMLQISLSVRYQCIIILKGAHSSITLPDGKVYFNSTGNPGMATAGSGDVLTGIILSLLAQGYKPADAAVAGVYIHGMAGDLAAQKIGQESVIASDITENIGDVYIWLRGKM